MLSEIHEWIVRKRNLRDAATQIQRVFRGYFGRAVFLRKKIKQVQEIRDRYRLARVVQRVWRGFV